MNFKLEDFKIDIIQHTSKVTGGSVTTSAAATNGDAGSSDNDIVDDHTSPGPQF